MSHDEAYKQAEKKIAEALTSRATELSLADMELTELPESIGQLTQLTELYLANNQLTNLPKKIGNLLNLKALYLFENPLDTRWIEGFPFLPNLEELGLQDTSVKKLPDTIFLLRKLRKLDLYGNEITDIPESIGKLENLEYLDLRRNKV